MVNISGVSKSFGNTPAVRDVSFSVEESQFCTLLGPSGCGKTTLLRMIAGLESPDAGDIHIAGASCVGIPAYRRDLAMVFQGYALFPHRTVLANVMFGLRMRRRGTRATRAAQASAALAMVGLSGFEDRYPRQLSGGQQQRVALARAIVLKPKVLLLDEPLSALDLQLRKTMRYELKQLQALTRITTVYVTHDQEEALSMSDQIVVMNRGIVEQVGSPVQIYRQPVSDFVAQFIGESNLISCRVAAMSDGAVMLALEGTDATVSVVRNRHSAERDKLVVDDPVSILVRAEKANLVGASSAQPGQLAGQVSGRAFLGAAMRHYVKLDATGQTVVADCADSLPVGERVAFAWNDADVVIVRRS